MRITCSTRFDITATGVRSNFQHHRIPFQDDVGHWIQDQISWQRARNQQRNWETINQIISLRTLPTDISRPTVIDENDCKIWKFEFVVDTPSSVELDGDPLGILTQDCQGVPMISGLDETPDIGDVLAPNINVFFTVHPDK